MPGATQPLQPSPKRMAGLAKSAVKVVSIWCIREIKMRRNSLTEVLTMPQSGVCMDATEFQLRRELRELRAKIDALYAVMESLLGSSDESLAYLAEKVQEQRWRLNEDE